MKFQAWASQFVKQIRQIVIVLAIGILALGTVACSPQNTTTSMDVPEASQADVQRAQGSLSDKEVDENALSKQGESLVRQSNTKGDTIVTPQ